MDVSGDTIRDTNEGYDKGYDKGYDVMILGDTIGDMTKVYNTILGIQFDLRDTILGDTEIALLRDTIHRIPQIYLCQGLLIYFQTCILHVFQIIVDFVNLTPFDSKFLHVHPPLT